MTPEELTYSILRSLASGRVYPIEGYQAGALPYIVYQRISTIPYNTICGDTGSSYVRMQIDVITDNYEDARDLARLVRRSMKNDAVFQSERHLSEPERGMYRVTQDYNIFEEGF